MKKVFLIGVGLGNPDTLTAKAKSTIESCDFLIGSKRLLTAFSGLSGEKKEAVLPERIVEIIQEASVQGIQAFIAELKS